jgi:predicted glutamine amidotransferase
VPCRMLVAAGKVPMAQLLANFKLVALNRNEQHELNRDNPDFVHGSGWGIVLGRLGRLAEFYKNAVPCWQDPKYQAYGSAVADFVLLHARRASPGSPVDLSYTHPFERRGSYFCHNGTITDPQFEDHRDSETFFHTILSCLTQCEAPEAAIRHAAGRMKAYTALNLIMTHKDHVYVLVQHRRHPKYYTMKYAENPHYAIVSSETLPSLEGAWTELRNGSLLRLNARTHQIEEC